MSWPGSAWCGAWARPQQPPGLDAFRLGLAFMASSPRGQHELDFEAEEAAILTAVGESRIDLVVDDTGDPEQLAHRLAEPGRDAGGASVVPRAEQLAGPARAARVSRC